MDELRRRVQQQRDAGVYGAGDIWNALAAPGAPQLVQDLTALARLADVAPAPPVPPADAHGVRAVAGRAKSAARDIARRPVGDVADRATAFNGTLVAYLVELATEVADLRVEVRRLSERAAGGD
jgi:hypothetical protein